MTAIREKITSPRTYHVREDGNDNNSGLGNTPQEAFSTIQKAIDVAASLDIGDFDLTIQIHKGTYTGANVLKSPVGSGSLIIQGNENCATDVKVSVTGAHAFMVRFQSGLFRLRHMAIETFETGSCVDNHGGNIEIQNLHFGNAGFNHILVAKNGYVGAYEKLTVAGGANAHVYCYNGHMKVNIVDITYLNTPHFTQANYFVYLNGVVTLGDVDFINGERVTGKKYRITTNAAILTTGKKPMQGSVDIPGSIPGELETGGQLYK